MDDAGSGDGTWAGWRAASPTGFDFRLRFGTETLHSEFVIDRGGRRIAMRPSASATPRDLEALLLGSVLTCTLRLRDVTCLHASVVAIDGRAVALVGPRGAGKSTTAAVLHERGARMVADDLAVVEEAGGHRVQPGPRRLRLRPDAVARLDPAARLPRVWADLPDRPPRRYLETAGSVEPVPLAAIHVLAPRDPTLRRVSVVPLTPARAMIALIANTAAPFMDPPGGRRQEFQRLGRLAREVPVREVRRPDGLDHLEEIRHAIQLDTMAPPASA